MKSRIPIVRRPPTRVDGCALAPVARPSKEAGARPEVGGRREYAIDVALAVVREEVLSTVVAVPGGYNMATLVAAHRLDFNLLVARSEAGAAWIAAALAWEAGRPALLFVITSPGVYGIMQALHYAHACRVPLVVVSGESALPDSVQAGDGVGGPSVTRVTSPVTEWSADVTRAPELPGALRRAVRLAAATSRPTHLNVPSHVATAEVPA